MQKDSPERLVGTDRVLAVLAELARHPEGVGLDELATVIGSAKPTVHRALASLRRAGFADQDGRGHYVLGDEFLRIAFAHHEARPDHLRIQSTLETLAQRWGETVHYAVLDARSVVYRAKVDPPTGAMKLNSTVGGRNPAHATAVGKMLLSTTLLTEDAVRAWVGDEPLARPSANTIGTVEELHRELELVRERGYAAEDQESQEGINCVALPAYLTSPSIPSGAISISALAYRMPLQKLIDDIPAIRAVIGERISTTPTI